MKFITTLDDERLGCYRPGVNATDNHTMLLVKSLCAALEEIKGMQGYFGDVTIVAKERDTALAAKEKAEGEACCLRDAVADVLEYTHDGDSLPLEGIWFDKVKALRAALSVPCAHKEEAERLKEENARMYGCLTGISEDGEDKGADMASRAEHCIEWMDSRRGGG